MRLTVLVERLPSPLSVPVDRLLRRGQSIPGTTRSPSACSGKQTVTSGSEPGVAVGKERCHADSNAPGNLVQYLAISRGAPEACARAVQPARSVDLHACCSRLSGMGPAPCAWRKQGCAGSPR